MTDLTPYMDAMSSLACALNALELDELPAAARHVRTAIAHLADFVTPLECPTDPRPFPPEDPPDSIDDIPPEEQVYTLIPNPNRNPN